MVPNANNKIAVVIFKFMDGTVAVLQIDGLILHLEHSGVVKVVWLVIVFFGPGGIWRF